MLVVAVAIAAVLIICMLSATPEQIRRARDRPAPLWLNVAFWMAIVVLALLVGQFLIFPPV